MWKYFSIFFLNNSLLFNKKMCQEDQVQKAPSVIAIETKLQK